MSQIIEALAAQHAAAMLMRIGQLVGEKGEPFDKAREIAIREHMPAFRSAVSGVQECALNLVNGFTGADLHPNDRLAAKQAEYRSWVDSGLVRDTWFNRFCSRWLGGPFSSG